MSEETIPATGSLGLEYTLDADGKSYSVSGIGTCTDSDIVIPSKYNGLTVTSIGPNAFYGCTFTSVIIGDNVTTIDGYAFAYCRSLITVHRLLFFFRREF